MRKNQTVLGIYGSGGLGREMLELAHIVNSKGEKWNDIILIDDNTSIKSIQGKNVTTFTWALDKYGSDLECIVAVGEPSARVNLFNKLLDKKCSIATLIHPEIYVPASTIIGAGTAVCYGTFLSCNVVLGENVLIQPQCNIGHDCVIGAHSVISGFTNMAGNCWVGEGTYIGLSSCIREKVSIGNYAIIGMGTVILQSVPDEVVIYGHPGKVISENENKKVFK